MEERIRQVTLFCLDLDGTVYRGDDCIPGAREFIDTLVRRGINYCFLTNNSSKSAAEYEKKLGRMGIPVAKERIFTSGQAAGAYLQHARPGARVFVLGTRSLAAELEAYGLAPVNGLEGADCVVAGFDTELTYAKLRTACDLIDAGVDYIATNPDFVCPIQGGRSLPDCGSICFMIEQATGKKPIVIGKPNADMVNHVRGRFSASQEQTAVIGDRLYTDIALGRNAGAIAICVLTGEATRESVLTSPIQPDYTISSIDELNGFF